ncbi:HAD hydrolase-like protein [Facklamia hominis]|uniref:HAD hydrolase-like protein n=1 Tax=Facklamia hominis TaxID=178214 RepID=UPI0029D41168|nr:HAD hydrolase-like protein [Facklamia hominis]WPJ91216.1 HAD hydrolase-like protein [Facklamia hominis]
MIGDQIMTDVIGANRLGLSVILVKPILNHDNVYTYVNRKLERYAFKILGIDSHSDWGEELGNK